MVANEIGQVDVFVDDVGGGGNDSASRSRWMASSSTGLVLGAATGGGTRKGMLTAQTQWTTMAAPPDDGEGKSTDDGWAALSDNGLLETEESSRSSTSLLDLYYSSVCRYADEEDGDHEDDDGDDVDEEDVVSEVSDDVDECISRDDTSTADPAVSVPTNHPEEVPVQQDAPDEPDDMPQHHHHPHSSSSECCDEPVTCSVGQGSGSSSVTLKSALRRPTASSGSRSLLRKKLRVKFNEALNTFLECDYVIYVDDDEYELLYQLAAAEQAAHQQQQHQQLQLQQQQQQQQQHQHQQQQQDQQQPQLVNVRSFELQLPESSSASVYPTTAQVEHLITGVPSSGVGNNGTDPVTLSPPDGYKDAAALYAAALVVQLSQGDGDQWATEEEEYYDEDAVTDDVETGQLNGWKTEEDVHQEEEENSTAVGEQPSPPRPPPPPVAEQPDPPRTGILKGGKLWKGAANNNANSSCPSSTTATAGDENGAARTEKEKPPAVRFIQLNDAPMEDDLNGPSAGHKAGGAHHSSAFQQLFPRARKLLLQDLPEADIQRLTASARATNAGYISSTAISRAMSSITSTSTHSSDDLKYEKALRVTEAEEVDHYQTLPVIRRTDVRQQRRADPPPPTESLVERLKWLTTTDDDEPSEETVVANEREAADGVSDPEASQAVTAVVDYASLADISAAMASPSETDAAPLPTATATPTSVMVTGAGAAATMSTGPEVQGEVLLVKPSKSGSEKSTYRKLNELFFRTKTKDKSKDKSGAHDQWKSSSSSLNRSFSPPPPAEVEPKMKPSKKPHLIHIVGLTGSKSAASTAAAHQQQQQGETLGRIPNVVPTVDHVYRAAVDLVTRNPAAAAAAAAGYALNDCSHPSAGDSYTLDDIDAALQAQIMAAGPGGGGMLAAAAASAEPCFLHTQDLRDETGGSRSSGSSGDSGVGSSHDASLSGMSGETDASQDELQAFVRQDATQGRIDRIKKRYSAALEDEAEDYGFLRRPSVRGIKTRFGSTSEIIQQMQAQLAPPAPSQQQQQQEQQMQKQQQQQQQQPQHLQQHMKTQSMGSWAYAGDLQGSIQAQALLDPREKRRSAMMMPNSSMMANSMHLPALPEDAAYFQASTAAAIRAGQHMMPSRPASVMNIYGSTGDLYQHLRAPIRPVIMHHPQSAPGQGQPPHLLERTSSVSSALDGGGGGGGSSSSSSAIYGTIRRQPVQTTFGDHMSPTREQPYVTGHPAAMMQPQQPVHPHHQLPLRMTVSTPGPGGNGGFMAGNMQQQQHQLQQQQQHPSLRPTGYLPAQDYSSAYATLPAKRASPYGVPAALMDPLLSNRYRQVLPPVVASQLIGLRSNSMIAADPRYAIPSVPHHPSSAASSSSSTTTSSTKDEREGPEGASSSPGLTHHDVSM